MVLSSVCIFLSVHIELHIQYYMCMRYNLNTCTVSQISLINKKECIVSMFDIWLKRLRRTHEASCNVRFHCAFVSFNT